MVPVSSYSKSIMARKPKRQAKGSGTVFMADGGRTWSIKWPENGLRRYQGGYQTQDQARQALDIIIGRIKAQLPGVPQKAKGPGVTFEVIKPDWLADRASFASVKDDENRYTKHLEPLLSHRTLEAVDTALVSSLVAHMKANGLDGASIERVLYTLSGLYRWAIRGKLIGYNPVKEYFAGLSKPERKKLKSSHDPDIDTQFLKNREDRAKVYTAMRPGSTQVAYALTAFAGLRPGEALAVLWSDIDLDAATVTVARQVRHGKVGLPKSQKARVVELMPDLVLMLRAWRKVCKGDLVCMPSKNRNAKAHLGPKLVHNHISKALVICGLPTMSWYEAGRHSYASACAMDGLDMAWLQKQLGHASIETTMRYAHLATGANQARLARSNVSFAA